MATPLHIGRYLLHLNAARRGEKLHLAVFDESKHPRGPGGKWAHHLGVAKEHLTAALNEHKLLGAKRDAGGDSLPHIGRKFRHLSQAQDALRLAKRGVPKDHPAAEHVHAAYSASGWDNESTMKNALKATKKALGEAQSSASSAAKSPQQQATERLAKSRGDKKAYVAPHPEDPSKYKVEEHEAARAGEHGTGDLNSAAEKVVGKNRVQLDSITEHGASFSLPGGDDEEHDYSIERAKDMPWVVTQAKPDDFVLSELPLDAYDDETDEYDPEQLTHHVLKAQDSVNALKESLGVLKDRVKQNG